MGLNMTLAEAKRISYNEMLIFEDQVNFRLRCEAIHDNRRRLADAGYTQETKQKFDSRMRGLDRELDQIQGEFFGNVPYPRPRRVKA